MMQVISNLFICFLLNLTFLKLIFFKINLLDICMRCSFHDILSGFNSSHCSCGTCGLFQSHRVAFYNDVRIISLIFL
jgi:hypothetical protein